MPPMDGKDLSIPERVRAQLVAIGIPRENHVPEMLTRLYPREFNIAATGLSTEDLDRVLVYLVGERVISAPGAAGPIPVKKVEPGWHFCQFYEDFDQLLDMVAPYVAEGLKNGEGCLWVMPEAVTTKAASDALAPYVEDVDGYVASGQLEMLSHPNWYLDPSGRLKSFEEITKGLIDRQDRALAKGFKFLRAAGDTGWVSGTEQSRDFIDYERKVNAAIGATKVAAVCTYRADVSPDELVDIVTAHQDALYRGPAS
jgi:hypothetical protein